jgi:hypothetical protein
MSSETKPVRLVLVTNLDTVLSNGSRVAWQSFRPAEAAATSKPTVYFSTLAADADATGTTTINLWIVGLQAKRYPVQLTVSNSSAVLNLPGTEPKALEAGTPVEIVAKGDGSAATLTFTGETCGLKAEPIWPGVPMGPVSSGDGETEPPPPTPGGGNEA